MDDRAILSVPFALADAQELIAREFGFGSWEALQAGDGETPTSAEPADGREPQMLGAYPQLFVADIEVSCRFFVKTLGFTLRFQYGQPAFYALVQRDGARLNLRFVHQPVLLRDLGTDKEAERDWLAASIPCRKYQIPVPGVQDGSGAYSSGFEKTTLGFRDFIVQDPDGNLIHFTE